MPLPRESEAAAAEVARILAELDARLEQHILTGRPLPNPTSILDRIEVQVERSLTAAVRQINPQATAFEIAVMVADIMTPLAITVEQSIGRARRVRQQAPRTPPAQEDDESRLAYIARVGAVAAFVGIATSRRRRRRPVNLRQVASELGIIRQLPRVTSSYGRMVVRTRTAINRNVHAADIAERDGLVLYVRDGMQGPTDEPCENVDGRYATPLWGRRHPVEHPQCTRRMRPVRLPPGEFVTLLS